VLAPGEDKAAELARFPTFESLSEDELRQMAELAVPRRYDDGQVIFREGDRSDTCFIVRTGRVRITRTHSGGRRLTLAELAAGEMFGELSMFDGEGRSATVDALEDTTTLALLERDVKRVLRAHPEIAVKMLARLANRLRAANEKLARQSFQPVAGRVASRCWPRSRRGAPKPPRPSTPTRARTASSRWRSWSRPRSPTSPSSPAPRARARAASSPTSSGRGS
jgi:cAMP-binding proteins - catabolite gene activator and regulatory subunit of cAMP-dependent protein kinases